MLDKSTFLILFFCWWNLWCSSLYSKETSVHFFPHKSYLGEVILPNGKSLKVKLAVQEEEKAQGLSGLSAAEIGNEEALLFYYAHTDKLKFWMPNTFFNLHIAFLDENLRVLEVKENMPYFPQAATISNYLQIPSTEEITARHVLEVKSSSPLAQQLKKGATLQWRSSRWSMKQIQQKVLKQQFSGL